MAPPPDPAALAAAQEAMKRFSTEAWALLSIGILVTIIRTFGRVKALGIKGLQPDDYLVWVGATFYAIETGLAYCVGAKAQGLANNGMTDEERAMLSPNSPEYHTRTIGSKIQLGGWASYSVLLWSLKASLLMFYLRLTVCHPSVEGNSAYLGLILYWQIHPDPGNACQPAISNQIIWTYLSCNVATDLYLLSIPIPMLWGANIKPLKKMGMIFLFGGGILVIACAILRVVLLVADPVNGAQLAGSYAVRETFVAVVTTNLPMVFPLLKTWLSPVFGSLIMSLRSTQRLDDKTTDNLRTFGGGNNRSWRGRGPPRPHHITDLTFSESEERMVENVKMQTLKAPSDTNLGAAPGGDNSTHKDVEIAVTYEERSTERPDRITIPRIEENSEPRANHCAFAKGPTRGT
ncbi:hypothetical protein DL766_009529 [Monosporascus sp. MC13-8B]|uniref:Rhodopsin domain-containing protein n=1 Tax=Monosporascus cannonballus TaxID=155416 RepID=A0ABY0HKE3_9PEZI|nr:hypothetical protein DL763_010620 [Monosporascus cannonballus]RYO95503.1 hypothetical protein DL762_000065 [Monosporascus cannonballus]RYP14978.1 hypothetical protein DL766_009529 [Monosporascus sp. MC13-8B]